MIYRGVATMVAGRATVNLNRDASVHPMMDGTFEALTQGAIVTSLHNQHAHDRPMSTPIVGSTFQIISEDPESTDEVAWVVMATRADSLIKSLVTTDDDGHIILEEDKEDPDLSELEDQIIETSDEAEDGEETTELWEMRGKGYLIHEDSRIERKRIKKYVPKES